MCVGKNGRLCVPGKAVRQNESRYPMQDVVTSLLHEEKGIEFWIAQTQKVFFIYLSYITVRWVKENAEDLTLFFKCQVGWKKKHADMSYIGR